MRWLNLLSFMTYPCILRKKIGQYKTCRTFHSILWYQIQPGENNDPGLLALLTKRSSYDTTAIIRPLTPRRSDLKA